MVELTYTMPAGKAILFPILSGECKYGTEKNDVEVCKCATEGNEFGVIFATIDGVRLQNLEQYRIQSDFFNIIYQRITFMTQTLAHSRLSLTASLYSRTFICCRRDIHFTVSVPNPLTQDLIMLKTQLII